MRELAIQKLEALVIEYEKSLTLSEYAKGRLSGFRLALEILKHV